MCVCILEVKFLFWIYIIIGNDISKFLKNSFIYIGYGDLGGKFWGDFGVIDE